MSGNGSKGLHYAPFPALNPWNWGALTAPHLYLSGIDGMRAGLDAWRAACDASRALLREQQNMLLANVHEQLVRMAGGQRADTENAADNFITPMFALAQYCTDANEALLNAQREALLRFTNKQEAA